MASRRAGRRAPTPRAAALAACLRLLLPTVAAAAEGAGAPPSAGGGGGHPCDEPGMRDQPFCDSSLTTAERAAAMEQRLAEMRAEYGELPPGDGQSASGFGVGSGEQGGGGGGGGRGGGSPDLQAGARPRCVHSSLSLCAQRP